MGCGLSEEGRMTAGFSLVCFGALLLLAAMGELAQLAGSRPIALAIWTLAVLPVTISLYRMRRRERIWYGCLEMAVAFGFFYFLLVGFDSEVPISAQLITNRTLIMFAAIYFMVRALDNIGEGLPASKFKQHWEAIFTDPKAS
jgi:uncharacterized protein with PQ loop repeat